MPPSSEASCRHTEGRELFGFGGKEARLGGWCIGASWPGSVYESHERVPVAIDLDAPELEECLCPLSNPTHAGTVEPLRDHIADGSLDGARADLQILLQQLLVVHHVDALLDVGGDLPKALPFALVAWTGGRDRGERGLQVTDDGLDVAAVEALPLLVHPLFQGLAAFAE